MLLQTLIKDHKIPEESLNCDQCKMAEKNIYLESLKCCTYHPFLPNYAVGAILHHGGPGKKILLEKISKKDFALPLGVMPNWQYRLDHKFKAGDAFGREEKLLCPFFNRLNGRCHIWSFRSSACASFYCESDRGHEGLMYWKYFNESLYYAEMALGQELLIQKGYEWSEVELQLEYLQSSEIHNPPWTEIPQDPYKEIWQHFHGKEDDFYLDCYQYFLNLSSQDWMEILGDEGIEKFTLLKKWSKP